MTARLLNRSLLRPGIRFISHQVTVAEPRLQRYTRRVGYATLTVGTMYLGDRFFNASAITRNIRTLWTCAMITLDYKLNFTPEKSDQIPLLHERVAERMYHLFTANGGLYIKIGQAIGANAALLPKPMQVKFAKLFDDAPQVSYPTILSVFTHEFGRPPSGPDGVFEIFEEQAVASASIAQVHKAKLKPEDGGEWVAVKIQKPDVAKQVNWDLGAYRMVMWMFENWAFDLPAYFIVDFISDHLRQELDFELEVRNAKQTAAFVATEPRLADSVHIPKVYPKYSTKRVMTAEWIDGVRLSDKPAIHKLMNEGPFDDRPLPPFITQSLQGGTKAIMQTMVELFSAQMFSFGWIHCDPHPGNVIIRPNPRHPSRPQLVLLDHGLYVRVNENFRKQWSILWKALLTADYEAVQTITRSWGVGLPDLFASATLMRPIRLKRKQAEAMDRIRKEQEAFAKLSNYEQSVKMKAKLKEFLIDTDRMPQELVFLLRNMRIVQGNNQSFGSPVNRIKITGYWASRSLSKNPNLTATEMLWEYWRHIVFRGVMFSLDAAFWTTRFKQWLWSKLGRFSLSFEDQIEQSMRGFAKGTLGIEVEAGAFGG